MGPSSGNTLAKHLLMDMEGSQMQTFDLGVVFYTHCFGAKLREHAPACLFFLQLQVSKSVTAIKPDGK